MNAENEQPAEDAAETPATPAESDTSEESDQGEDSGGLPLPFAPDPDDDSPLGDTDQHSDA